jgi:hypothetical protein
MATNASKAAQMATALCARKEEDKPIPLRLPV